MAALGRWRVSDVAGIPTTRIGPSPGAMVRGLGETPRKRATHIHVHMPSPAKVHDQAPPASNNPSATGFPISAGDTFTVGADCSADGFSLRRVRVGDVDKDGMETPPGDAVFGEENPPGGRSLDTLRRRMAVRQHDRTRPELERDQLAAVQSYLDAIWTPK
jgi:hypothetical protein